MQIEEYIDSNGDYDEYYFFHRRYKTAIFSYVSAMYIHQFTDIIPNNLEVTVYKGYNPHRINETVKIHYVTKSIYDLERTICDFIKNRNEIELELFSKVINRYARYKDKDLNKLYSYSKKMKIYDKVREILEVVYE